MLVSRMALVFAALGLFLLAAHASTPYSGAPIALPGTFEAENFDKGGEGSGYHDLSAGNSGGQYRRQEGVDIIASADAQGGGYVVNNFQGGEWLAYTVNVAATANYDISIRASSNNASATPAFHVEVDGVNVTGSVTVPRTGSWNVFKSVGKQGISLAAGAHVLKLVAKGGEGVGYHDRTAGNAGKVCRTAEDVDLVVSADSAGGGYVVNNFDTGEWLATP